MSGRERAALPAFSLPSLLCFKMSAGSCFYSGMVKPTEQETTATDKSLLPTVPKRRGCHATQGPQRGPGLSGVRGKPGPEPSRWFLWVRQGR